MGKDTRSNLYTIEDNTLRSLMNDSQIQQILPCLKPAAESLSLINKGKKCNKCERERAQGISEALGQARRCIANTRGAALNQLKAALNTKQIRVLARNPSGKTVKWTL